VPGGKSSSLGGLSSPAPSSLMSNHGVFQVASSPSSATTAAAAAASTTTPATAEATIWRRSPSSLS